MDGAARFAVRKPDSLADQRGMGPQDDGVTEMEEGLYERVPLGQHPRLEPASVMPKDDPIKAETQKGRP
jgi:hypothetical protein